MCYVAASRRWIAEYDLGGHEIIGRSHYEFAGDIPERWKEAHRRGLAGEGSKCDEDPFERSDGTVQWIRWEVVPWREGDGSVGGIILFAEDITGQRETEHRLTLAASVFTNAREGITITITSSHSTNPSSSRRQLDHPLRMAIAPRPNRTSAMPNVVP